MQQTLVCKGELKTSRFGVPSSKGYDGVHIRGKLAVQHYTRSVIDILLDVMPNVQPTPPRMPGPKSNAKAMKSGPFHNRVNLTQAQPKFVKKSNQNFASALLSNQSQHFATPATGSNSSPVGGIPAHFNRFSAVQGN